MKTVDESLKYADEFCSSESYVVCLATEFRRLREENKRMRKDADVGAAIQRAAAELPSGYIVGISVEADAATVELCLPTGHIKTMDADDDNRLAAEINAAIDAAADRLLEGGE